MRNNTITVLGLMGQSVFMELDHFHSNGETVHCRSLYIEPGGKGCNQAVAAKRLGADVNFIATLGDDDYGRLSRDFLVREGIEACTQFVTGRQTAYACILTDSYGENRVTVFSGAAGCLGAEQVNKYRDKIRGSDILLLNLEYPMEANLQALDIAAKDGVRVIVNPAPYSGESIRELSRAWLITPNRQEAAAMAGLSQDVSPEELALALRDLGFPRLILTLGSKGALLLEDGHLEMLSAEKRQAVDTTGAGDCFNGALAASLARGHSLRDSAHFAVKASGLSVEKRYVMKSLPHLGELE